MNKINTYLLYISKQRTILSYPVKLSLKRKDEYCMALEIALGPQ